MASGPYAAGAFPRCYYYVVWCFCWKCVIRVVLVRRTFSLPDGFQRQCAFQFREGVYGMQLCPDTQLLIATQVGVPREWWARQLLLTAHWTAGGQCLFI
jgi:hypothetical protein